MYGGVSLAIYINGVTQELLDMVRATAPSTSGGADALVPDAELKGAMPVYRRLGQYLENERKKLVARSKPLDGVPEAEIDDWNAWRSAEIKTRFIVDVISGTSAGGINGVFLAKALANNQGLDGLKNLWMSEGDLARLLNDSGSIADLREYGLRVAEPRESLLNNQRMYRKLLEALETMQPPAAAEPAAASPLVAELDLFITTTDIAGIPLPISLADGLIFERQHRNVFHFRYDDFDAVNKNQSEDDGVSNDFLKPNDPFLAYAARCTSSFPFAFEPMRLSDIDAVTRTFWKGHPYFDAADRTADWGRFFENYLRTSLAEIQQRLSGRKSERPAKTELEAYRAKLQTQLRADFRDRAFGDGGYLDNKPFSHATAILMRRRADVPVARKLIYIEPAPEHPERLPEKKEKPDFLQNVLAAVVDLPRQETIREDLERLFERNRMVERIGALSRDVDDDLAATPVGWLRLPFHDSWLADLIALHGVSYGAYHRLKLEEITALLSERIAQAASFSPDSQEGSALLEVVRAWRTQNFAANQNGVGKRSENAFLADFDIRFCLRRLAFAARRINELARLDDNAFRIIESAFVSIQTRGTGAAANRAEARAEARRIIARLEMDSEWRAAFRAELNAIKKNKVSPHVLANRRREEEMHRCPQEIQIGDATTSVTLGDLIGKLGIAWADLVALMDAAASERPALARDLIAPPERMLALREIEEFFRASFGGAGGVAVSSDSDTDFADAAVLARRIVEHFRKSFQLYDLVTFPVQFGSGAGEANIVQVSRISPEDAVGLIDERNDPRRKLAGTTLMNFGAFLQRSWRRNDMLWGRLDGAERLICAVFAPEDDTEKAIRRGLIVEAQKAILRDELTSADHVSICKLIGQFVSDAGPTRRDAAALREFVASALANDPALPTRVEAILQSCLGTEDKLWDFYTKSYEVDRSVDAESAVRLIARSTDIVGRMLQQLAHTYRADPAGRVAQRIAMLGRIFWHIVEVAVPRSLPSLFFQHWIGVIYVLDFILIFGGILFGHDEVKNFGWSLLAVTIGVNVIVAGLTDYITGRLKSFVVLRALLAAALIALLACGVTFVAAHFSAIPREDENIIGISMAGLFALVLGWAEWKRGLRLLDDARPEPVRWQPLALLAGLATFFGIALTIIGPGKMAAVELAGSSQALARWIGWHPTWQWRTQLIVDFPFILFYVALLSSACAAAARFWTARAAAVKAADETVAAIKARDATGRRFSGFARITFAIGGLQWLAGGFDGVENWALLHFLDHTESLAAPRIAFLAAFLKFCLTVVGCLCAAIGIWFAQPPLPSPENARAKRDRNAWRIAAAVLVVTAIIFAKSALSGLRAPPPNQAPISIPASVR